MTCIANMFCCRSISREGKWKDMNEKWVKKIVVLTCIYFVRMKMDWISGVWKGNVPNFGLKKAAIECLNEDHILLIIF